MASKHATVFVILLAILYVIPKSQTQTFQSPCPRLFVYEPKGTEPDRWYGILTLLAESDLNGVWLRLILDKPSLQLGNWFGEVVTEDNKEYLIKNRNHKLKANTPETLRFYIKYNTAEPVPQLAAIRLNAKTICPEGAATTAAPTETGQLITSSELSTTIRPQVILPEIPTSSGGSGSNINRPPDSLNPSNTGSGDDDDFFHGDFNGGFSGFNFRPGRDVECGTVAIRPKRQVSYYDYHNGQYSPQVNYRLPENQYYRFYRYINDIVNALAIRQVQPRPLITYGQTTREGEYPWHAALYHAGGVSLNYICGGSLISRYHVITVGHCVTKARSHTVQNPEHLLIYLGKYYLKRWSNPGIQDHPVSRIIRHPQYNPETFANDIAIIKMTTPAEYTDYVRPICLWGGSKDFNSLIGKYGTVVGWGFDENGKLTEGLTMVKMPIVSKETCIYSFADFFSRYTTSETYCAGFKNGTSVCNGDSGGGMIFPKETGNSNKAWQLRGLVSVSVALQNEFKCNPNHYVVFTDAAKYHDFIKAAMSV